MSRYVMKTLPCELTETELHDRHDELAVLEGRKDSTRRQIEELKAEQKAVKESLGRTEGAISRLASIIRKRAEERTVRCEVIFDFAANRLAHRRQDTGEIVLVRALEDAERQMVIADEKEQQAPSEEVLELMNTFETQMHTERSEDEDDEELDHDEAAGDDDARARLHAKALEQARQEGREDHAAGRSENRYEDGEFADAWDEGWNEASDEQEDETLPGEPTEE